VVLITIDTLRADHALATVVPPGEAGGFSAWVGRGVQFRAAFSSASTTAPAHTALLTGLYPSFTSVGRVNGDYALVAATETLAERLAAAGVGTAAIVSNAVLKASLGLGQGFERYDDRMAGREANRPYREQYAPEAVDKALALLAGRGPGPFFLWLHLQDPHGPYIPPPPWDRVRPLVPGPNLVLPVSPGHIGFRAIPRYQEFPGDRSFLGYAARYAGEVAYAGAELERLWGRLGRLVESGQARVVLTADHGEAMGEDGYYFCHGHSVEPDQVRVPLVLAGPGWEGGRVVEAPVTTVSVFRTVLRFFGLDAPGDGALPPPLDPDGAPEGPLFTESMRQVGVVWRGHYLRRDRAPATPRPGDQGVVPGERFGPMAGQSCDWTLRGRMLAMLRRFEEEGDRAQARFAAERTATQRTAEDRKALKALGYLQ
jgi:arylsulfatase